MTRQRLLHLLNDNNNIQILYEYYVDERVKIGKDYMPPEVFQQNINVYVSFMGNQFIPDTIIKLIQEHDIRELSLNGKTIKYI